jgi:hypothetical protein
MKEVLDFVYVYVIPVLLAAIFAPKLANFVARNYAKLKKKKK